MKLSVIVPVYNEEKTIEEILQRLISQLKDIKKEIIVVDDGSSDNSKEKIRNFISKHKEIKLIEKNNGGKGTAVKMGIDRSCGDFILIQDADLEYNPKDIPVLLEHADKKNAVYGTRLKRLPNFRKDERTPDFFIQYLGNKFLSLITSILYGQWITDMETGYKLFPRKSMESIKLFSKTFDFEPEITAKLLRKGYTIVEVPITTNPRGYKEGKKLNAFRDGPLALWTLIKYRFRE